MSRPLNPTLGEQPTLCDGVVRLEPFCAEEAGLTGMGAWDADEEHQRWFDWPQGWRSDREHRERAIAAGRAAWEDGSRWCFMAHEALGDAVVGWCELHLGGTGADVSYGTLPAHRRRGVARRSVRLVCAYAFARDARLERIELCCDLENAASRAVAEAAGFRLERSYFEQEPAGRYEPLRGQRREMALYALRRPDAPSALESASTARATASAPRRKGAA